MKQKIVSKELQDALYDIESAFEDFSADERKQKLDAIKARYSDPDQLKHIETKINLEYMKREHKMHS